MVGIADCECNCNSICKHIASTVNVTVSVTVNVSLIVNVNVTVTVIENCLHFEKAVDQYLEMCVFHVCLSVYVSVVYNLSPISMPLIG